MRVSGGELRSRIIPSPPGDAVRPTPGRVKEAFFAMLGDALAKTRVLDLFAGTGAIGIEALSRGAASAVFVEAHAPTAERLRGVLAAFGVTARATVICGRAERVAARLAGRFDIVYADPPYDLPPPVAALDELAERGALDAATTIVYEHRATAPPLASPGFVTLRDARYGDVSLQFVRRSD